jgi:hypothetical protein
VCDLFDLRADGHVDTEFFAEFADEAVFEGFVGFDFATGEFPEEAEVIAGAALGDEELASAEDQAGGDIDDFGHDRNECTDFIRAVSAVPWVAFLIFPALKRRVIVGRPFGTVKHQIHGSAG